MKKRCPPPVWIVLAILLALGAFADISASAIRDSESTAHADSAAFYQVVDTYHYPGFKVIQFNLPVLSHYSYLLISDGQALVIDPGRDVQAYLTAAKDESATIRGVFLTHSHADFVAGHMELAEVLNCPIYASAEAGAEFPHQALHDGSTLQLGKAFIRFATTPGHTPDGLCAYVYSTGQRAVPQLLFTGDTLFVGSVGRPDLVGDKVSAAALASMMFDTWHHKLSNAGDQTVILPAHGAGSLCGAHLSDSPASTIGAEKVSNPYLQHSSRGAFIAAVLEGLPEAPQYFKYNAAMNRKGPEPVDWKAPLPDRLSPAPELTDAGRYYVVDVRQPQAYASGHIPNSVNIGLRGRFETWVGIMVPWQAQLVLCGDEPQLQEALYRLHRVGYKAQVITLRDWRDAGLPIATSNLVSPAELYRAMQQSEAPVVVDVRLPSEWMGLRIGTVVNLPLNHLAELSSQLDPGLPTVAVCNSAYRSSMAVGILQRRGFKRVSSLAGGSAAWIAAGFPVFGSEAKSGGQNGTSRDAAQRQVRLPERISAAELQRLLMDLPGTFDLVDIRPAVQFADFSIAGSQNVGIPDLMFDPRHLTGVGPLIIVDRDGSLAMAVAGILSQKTERSIKALYGGVQAYWAESELNNAVQEVDLPGASGSGSVPGSMGEPADKSDRTLNPRQETPEPPTPGTPAPSPPKKKSAGC